MLLKTVALGRDFGTEVEVVSGLEPGDAVILNPSDSIVGGHAGAGGAAAGEGEDGRKPAQNRLRRKAG